MGGNPRRLRGAGAPALVSQREKAYTATTLGCWGMGRRPEGGRSGRSRESQLAMSAPPRSRRVLVVEDQMLVGLEIVSFLEDLGYEAVGPCGHVQTALLAVTKEPIDAALLDADLAGESVEPIADFLRRRGIPFALVTGYARDRLPARLRDAPYVAKPFTFADVKAVVSALLAPG